MPTVEEVYETASRMPAPDRFRLVQKLLDDLDQEGDRDPKIAAGVKHLAMRSRRPQKDRDSWRRSVGAFDSDPVMDEVLESGRRIREAERTPG